MHTHELTLVAEDVTEDTGTGTALVDPRALYVAPTPAQYGAKPIPREEVLKVADNNPMPRVPRSHDRLDNPSAAADRILRRIFPQYFQARTEMTDTEMEQAINRAIEDHRALGMTEQVESMKLHAAGFRGLRTLLKSDEDLLRPDSLIPMEYLPHLFMAVPVWYFYTDVWKLPELQKVNAGDDPFVDLQLVDICGRCNTARWSDTFLMFNRRKRPLQEYRGDIIPPKMLSRIRTMAPLCEHLVIMTPYHDVAGRDWENLAWLRSIDPYIIGFLKNVPFMVVLGRFSDSGTFPLYHELVADTIAFLRANVEKLRGFDRVQNPYWYRAGSRCATQPQLGQHLIKHTNALLAAFDRGELFDWLRGVEPKKA